MKKEEEKQRRKIKKKEKNNIKEITELIYDEKSKSIKKTREKEIH